MEEQSNNNNPSGDCANYLELISQDVIMQPVQEEI